MGRRCVSGTSALSIGMVRRVARIAGREVAEGEIVTLQGSTGEVHKDRVERPRFYSRQMACRVCESKAGFDLNADLNVHLGLVEPFER